MKVRAFFYIADILLAEVAVNIKFFSENKLSKEKIFSLCESNIE